MAEKNLTKKLTKLIKDADKLVQDVEKGIEQTIVGINDLKQSWEKPRKERLMASPFIR